MKCPRCGTPNAKYINEKGLSRNQRRKGFGGDVRTRGERWRGGISKDRIKCKQCGVFEV